MIMATIAICNNKGGVGKTATCLAMAGAMRARGLKTLIVDLDQQANATQAAEVEGGDGVVTAYDLLTTDEWTAKQAIQPSKVGDIIPGDMLVAEAESEMSRLDTPLTMLADALEGIRDSYDHILIDCPPSLGLVTRNALVAADEVIVVVQPDDASVTGCGNVMAAVGKIRRNRHLNPDLRIAGILVNHYDGRRLLSKSIDASLPEFASECGTRLFDARIRACESIRQAQSLGESIYDYAISSNGAQDYAAFVDEYLALAGKGERDERSGCAEPVRALG